MVWRPAQYSQLRGSGARSLNRVADTGTKVRPPSALRHSPTGPPASMMMPPSAAGGAAATASTGCHSRSLSRIGRPEPSLLASQVGAAALLSRISTPARFDPARTMLPAKARPSQEPPCQPRLIRFQPSGSSSPVTRNSMRAAPSPCCPASAEMPAQR